MDILVTGANGFLGRHIVEALKNNNIKSLSRASGNFKVFLENEIPNFEQQFDLVIHAAGKAHSIPKNNEERQHFNDVNVIGTKNLLLGLEKVLPKHFVFISSVSVYGQDLGININEDHALKAKDAYGLSKIEAETLVNDWCLKHNIICTVLRLPLLVGKNPPGNLKTMIQAIEKGYYFNIGGGKARKSMVLAADVASFIPKVALVGGIYNLTDAHHPNFAELSTVISTQKKKRLPFNLPIFVGRIIGIIGDLLGDYAPVNTLKLKKMTSDLTFDDDRARTKLGWNPRPVLEYLKSNSL